MFCLKKSKIFQFSKIYSLEIYKSTRNEGRPKRKLWTWWVFSWIRKRKCFIANKISLFMFQKKRSYRKSKPSLLTTCHLWRPQFLYICRKWNIVYHSTSILKESRHLRHSIYLNYHKIKYAELLGCLLLLVSENYTFTI